MTEPAQRSHDPTSTMAPSRRFSLRSHLRHFTALVLGMTLVAACGGTAQVKTTSTALSFGYADALPVEGQLLVGSLQLEGTEEAISPAQASELLLLWKAFRSLRNSETAAQAEIDAVITQIEETMTADQLTAIEAMQLTADDLNELVRQRASQPVAAVGSPATSGSVQGQLPGGGDRPGGFGPGPGGDDGMAFLAPSSGQGTILSATSTNVPSQDLTVDAAATNRATSGLVDSLIALLETRVDV